MNSLSGKDILLLVALTLFWGLNWPVMKFGVTHIPPVTFRVMGMSCSLPVMWLIARRMNESIAIPKKHLPALVSLAVSNVFLCQTLMIIGVKMLSSGRAAILCYTMPIWAVIFSCVLFREKLTRPALFGILCAAAGALLLLSGEFSALSSSSTGVLIMLAAAAIWGYGTVQLKRKLIPIPTSALTFWMIAMSAAAMFIVSLILEPGSWHMPESLEWAAILYNAIFVFGIAATIWNKMARTLPPVASSLSVMMVPVVGVFSGSWLLSETPHWQDYAAMLLILASMSAVLLKPGKPPRK